MQVLVLVLQLCGGQPSEGVFVGAFLSMSSTAVVILSFFFTLRINVEIAHYICLENTETFDYSLFFQLILYLNPYVVNVKVERFMC